tara:strand:+ start:5590 stop:6618 length:1029 start_codon:yes stop_codon:yes gene_type:complete
MLKEKILILKNDRAGDLFTSLTLISSLISAYQNITIYLSELNIGFSFLFSKTNIKKINFNLSFINKILIFIDILTNKYHKVYILTPKSYYFFLPLIFRKVKFYAIVYDNKKNLRPSKFLRKYLYKYKIIYRDKINLKNYHNLQIDLLEDISILDSNHLSLSVPIINNQLKELLPKNFLLFQFRYLFFEKLGWGINEFKYLMSQIQNKYHFVLFSSDIENNKFSKYFNNYFEDNFSIIDTNTYDKKINAKNKNIFYLKNINSFNLFLILKESEINLAKEGIFSHISYFHKKKCHNLFNFRISSKDDIMHEKISYSEWCKGMNYNFSFLNSDIKKASRKILKNI